MVAWPSGVPHSLTRYGARQKLSQATAAARLEPGWAAPSPPSLINFSLATWIRPTGKLMSHTPHILPLFSVSFYSKTPQKSCLFFGSQIPLQLLSELPSALKWLIKGTKDPTLLNAKVSPKVSLSP